MGMGEMLASEITIWAALAIVIVIFLIVLGGIADPANTILAGTGVNGTVLSVISDFQTGLSEPKNWVAIVIIALIGFGIIKFVKDRN